MLKLIEGNILDIEEGVICHFCNTEGIMGAGLAAQIKQRYPEVFDLYRKSSRELGSVKVARAAKTLWVANMVTQDLKGRGTQYSAVFKALHTLNRDYNYVAQNMAMYFPEFVGCGLGKGNPNAIQAAIEFFFPEAILVRYKS